MTINLDSTAAYAYNELGLLALRLNQWDQAIDQFNAALRFSPTWVLPWVNLGTGYFNNKLPVKAEACWTADRPKPGTLLYSRQLAKNTCVH